MKEYLWLIGGAAFAGLTIFAKKFAPARLGVLGTVTKKAGDSVTTGITVKNIGGVSGTWTVSYDFEDSAGRAPIKDPYWVVTLAPNEQRTLSDIQTVPSGYEGGTYRLVVYWGVGSIAKPGVLPNVAPQDWWLSIVTPQFSIVGSTVS